MRFNFIIYRNDFNQFLFMDELAVPRKRTRVDFEKFLLLNGLQIKFVT
jgi:hypothetical protein